MSILLDHCTPQRYYHLVKAWAYPVSLLKEHIDVRSHDPDVLGVAQKLDAVLLTVDTDFGNIVQYPPTNYQGIIVLGDQHRAQVAVGEKLREVLEALYRDRLRGVLVVVQADGYRIYR